MTAGAMANPAAWGVLVLRVTLGVTFIMHGYLVYWMVRPPGMGAYLIRLGFPTNTVFLATWYLIVAHLVGGALIAVGLWTRPAALLNIPIMLVAVALIHAPQGFFMKAVIVDSAAGRAMTMGYEFPLLVLACTIAVALIGGGPLSIDGERPSPRRRLESHRAASRRSER